MGMKRENQNACCETCENLITAGEGDHICTECGEPKVPISDYAPTDEYFACGGKYYKEKQEETL